MTSADHIQTVIVGGGVIGIAIARALSRAGQEVLLLEAESRPGQHASSHNSQVIHAGIYYPRGSLRARLCVAGKDMLYDYCRTRHITHRRLGKLIVATQADQLEQMQELMRLGQANGVHDLSIISAAEAQALEPELACFGAIVSPSTGIMDAPALMLSLLGEAEASGAMLALASPLSGAISDTKGFRLEVADADHTTLTCSILINAAGFGAWDVARSVQGLRTDSIPPRHFVKGNYFSLSGVANPFSRLIYPVPQDDTLGVHYVCDLGGQVKFGPDIERLPDLERSTEYHPDYSVDTDRRPAFEDAVRQYWPGLPDSALMPDTSGIRPRVYGRGEPKADYLFAGPQEHGVAGLYQLFGMESPGLTSCLAIAAHVRDWIGQLHPSALKG
jgi:L-2-hydroxyglutarate oxidase LhgO